MREIEDSSGTPQYSLLQARPNNSQKLVGESLRRNRTLAWSERISPKIFINENRRYDNSLEEESSRSLPKLRPQRNTSRTDAPTAGCPWEDALRGHDITSVAILPKMHNPNLSLRKCQINPNRGPSAKHECPQTRENKERLRNCQIGGA